MIFDYEGVLVNEGNYMIEADEETADFYQLIDGKLVFFAQWDFVNQLNKTSIEEKLKELESIPENNEDEIFIKNYLRKIYARKSNPDPKGMYLVTGKKIIKLLDDVKIKNHIDIQFDHHICLVDKPYYN